MMNKTIITFLLFLFHIGLAKSDNVRHLTVTVEPGDAVYSLLSEYELHSYDCNIESFYKINELSTGDPILAHKTYKLPLKVFEYNGTSIRSTIGNDDWDLAIAIQDYNKDLKQKGVKDYYMDDGILYVPYHLSGCEELPAITSSENKIEYIETDIYFGDGKIKKESDHLSNHVFYVISGHGGPDPGAMCHKSGHSLCEDEYAYDVSLRLAKNLLMNGATVYFIVKDPDDGIRDETFLKLDRDEISMDGSPIPLNQLKRLQQRVDEVNNAYYREQKEGGEKIHRMISIHVDSRTTGLKQDVFFYHAEQSSSGKVLANQLQDTFREKYAIHQKGRGYEGTVTPRNLYVLRKTIPTAVYVELANIQNPNNQKRILPYSNRQVLANWLYEGLTK